ncbi:MAG: DUF4340 domain-containing protein, partial [Myxococcota bacterium]
MNPKTTGLLFLAAAALAAFVYFYEIRGEEGRRAADEAEERVFAGIVEDDITAIALDTADGAPVRAVRAEGAWRLVEPLSFPADAFAFDAMASALVEISRETSIEEAQAPAVYGLDDDRREIDFEAGGALHSLRLGDAAPVGSNTYASADGRPDVYVVPTYRVNAFKKTLADLRDKRLLSFDREAVDRIDVHWPGEHVELEKGEDGWRMLRPQGLLADQETVANLLSDLSFLRANGFEDDPPADDVSGLDAPAFAVTLSGGGEGDGEPFEVALAIGSRPDGDERLARTIHPSLYRLAADRVTDLPTEVAAYRFKQLGDFRVADAARIDVIFHTESGESIGISSEKADVGWTSQPETFAPGKLAALVAALSDLTARDVVAESMGPDELAELGLAPANAVFNVFGAAPDSGEGEGAPVLAEISVGLLRGSEGILAQRAGDEVVYLLDAELAELPGMCARCRPQEAT